ncbi:hypothetical protein HanIR_Chr01g0000731 [Helianthus annuus]|nr:hypothetical protein HanIR_Chr01g0000731 [Helianthus annuus]
MKHAVGKVRYRRRGSTSHIQTSHILKKPCLASSSGCPTCHTPTFNPPRRNDLHAHTGRCSTTSTSNYLSHAKSPQYHTSSPLSLMLEAIRN